MRRISTSVRIAERTSTRSDFLAIAEQLILPPWRANCRVTRLLITDIPPKLWSRPISGMTRRTVAQCTPPMSERMGLIIRNATSDAPRHTPAVTPNSCVMGADEMNPAA